MKQKVNGWLRFIGTLIALIMLGFTLGSLIWKASATDATQNKAISVNESNIVESKGAVKEIRVVQQQVLQTMTKIDTNQRHMMATQQKILEKLDK